MVEVITRRKFIKESAKAAAFAAAAAKLGLPIIGAGASQSCKSNTSPETEKILLRYRNVEVTYNRKPGPYPNPIDETRPRFYYLLYDPQNEHIDEMGLETRSKGYRMGYKRMDEHDENLYKCKLEKVLVQTDEFNEPHSSYVSDGKLWEGLAGGVESTYTSEGVSIPGSLVVGFCQAGYTMYWKLV